MSELTFFPYLLQISVVEFRAPVCVLFILNMVHSFLEEVGDPLLYVYFILA